MNKLSQDYVGYVLSDGTLRNEDLIPKLMFFLEEHNPEQAAKLTMEYAGEGWGYSMAGLGFGDPFDETQEELAPDLLEDLYYALEEIAPEGCYFGGHWADPASVGFYLNEEDEIYTEDLPYFLFEKLSRNELLELLQWAKSSEFVDNLEKALGK